MNEAHLQPGDPIEVVRLGDIGKESIDGLLSAYGLSMRTLDPQREIPGSYWGEDEAGLIGDELLVREDTPLHSILHETCHYVCMDKDRRQSVHTNAGGDYDEENAVCYLQIILADHIENFDRQQMFRDMDSWGYTFRLGSAQIWFEQDADDAQAFLQDQGITDGHNQPTFKIRE